MYKSKSKSTNILLIVPICFVSIWNLFRCWIGDLQVTDSLMYYRTRLVGNVSHCCHFVSCHCKPVPCRTHRFIKSTNRVKAPAAWNPGSVSDNFNANRKRRSFERKSSYDSRVTCFDLGNKWPLSLLNSCIDVGSSSVDWPNQRSTLQMISKVFHF